MVASAAARFAVRENHPLPVSQAATGWHSWLLRWHLTSKISNFKCDFPP